MNSLKLTVLLAMALIMCSSVSAKKRSGDYRFEGDGTAYTEPKEYTPNACEYKKGKLSGHFATYFAAINHNQYDDGDVCGRCVYARGVGGKSSGKSVLFKLIDYCANCPKGDLDFSTKGLKAITGYTWDRKPIEWKFASCDGPKFLDKNGNPIDDDNDDN